MTEETPEQIIQGLHLRMLKAISLHEPQVICQPHHIHKTNWGVNRHDCGGPYIYRCLVCAKTRDSACATWQALTGMTVPADEMGD